MGVVCMSVVYVAGTGTMPCAIIYCLKHSITISDTDCHGLRRHTHVYIHVDVSISKRMAPSYDHRMIYDT